MKPSLKKISSLEQTAGEMLRRLRPSARKAGLSPGTPVHVGEEVDQEVTVTVCAYDPEHYQCALLTPAQLKGNPALRQDPLITWINIEGLNRVDLIETICNEFVVHPLMLGMMAVLGGGHGDLFQEEVFLME
jgi:magnesium transporter